MWAASPGSSLTAPGGIFHRASTSAENRPSTTLAPPRRKPSTTSETEAAAASAGEDFMENLAAEGSAEDSAAGAFPQAGVPADIVERFKVFGVREKE